MSRACRPCCCAAPMPQSAQLLTSDVDERDRPFICGERTRGRVLPHQSRRAASITPSPAAWPTRPMPICCGGRRASPTWRRRSASPMPSTGSSPARCWPTTARRASTGRRSCRRSKIAKFQREHRRDGLQVPVRHAGRLPQPEPGMFNLARGYKERGMAAYSELQQAEFAAEADGYTATRHQREVGVGYFDAVATAASAASPPPRRCPAAPRRRSFTTRRPRPRVASCGGEIGPRWRGARDRAPASRL